MAQDRSTRQRSGPPSATLTRTLAVLLVVCLIECVAGSCLSYGHSCWGAHGKRSGKSPGSASDWYLTRLLRRMVANGEVEVPKPSLENIGLNAIFRAEASDDSAQNRLTDMDDASTEVLGSKRMPGGIPMLDDDMLSKSKVWQIMRAASEED